MSVALSIVGAMLSTTLGACSLVLDTSLQQCNSNADCTSRGGAFASSTCTTSHVCVSLSPDGGGPPLMGNGGGAGDGGDIVEGGVDPVWGCLGQVVVEMPRAQTVKVTVPMWDLLRQMPIVDVSLRLCNRLDPTCSNPISAALEPDPQGILVLDAPARFDGYGLILSRMTDAAAIGKWLPSVLFFNPPLVRDFQYDQVPLFRADDLAALAIAQGNMIDPALGEVFSGMRDCSGKAAAGVTWEPSRIGETSKRFYYFNGLPDEAAVSTDSTGLGGLINAPTGTLTLTATVQATGKRIGSATVLVRSGYASYTYLAPTP